MHYKRQSARGPPDGSCQDTIDQKIRETRTPQWKGITDETTLH